MQLVQPPDESNRELLLAQRRDVEVSPRFMFLLEQAREWVNFVLKPEYRPDPRDAFLVFPSENGLYDTIRSIHRAVNLEIATAQSKYLLGIVARGVLAMPGSSALSIAEEAAKRIFVSDQRIRLTQTAYDGLATYGIQDVSHGAESTEWPHWIDSLSWRVDDSAVSFVMLKAGGDPSREVISSEDEDNVHWF